MVASCECDDKKLETSFSRSLAPGTRFLRILCVLGAPLPVPRRAWLPGRTLMIGARRLERGRSTANRTARSSVRIYPANATCPCGVCNFPRCDDELVPWNELWMCVCVLVFALDRVGVFFLCVLGTHSFVVLSLKSICCP